MKKNNALKAFSLSEVIVVMVILSILASIMIPTFTGYMELDKERSSLNDGITLYSAANAAITKAYTMHRNEFEVSIKMHLNYIETDEFGNETNKKSDAYYGRLTNGGLYTVQCSKQNPSNSGKYDPALGFSNFYPGDSGRNKGDAIIAKNILMALDAYDSQYLDAIDERLRFPKDLKPAGDLDRTYTVSEYNEYVRTQSYDIYLHDELDTEYNGKQVHYKAGTKGKLNVKCAGIIICYGKSSPTSEGEIIYTEYGDDRGYLTICINPKWYHTLKVELSEVRNHALDEDNDARLKNQNPDDPIVLVIEDGLYEAPDAKK